MRIQVKLKITHRLKLQNKIARISDKTVERDWEKASKSWERAQESEEKAWESTEKVKREWRRWQESMRK